MRTNKLLLIVAAFAVLALDSYAPASDWVSKDISCSVNGATKAVGADGYDIAGSGADIWQTSDSFRLVYQRVGGDFDISARIVSLENTNEWAKAGLMVRQSKDPGSIHAMMCVSAAKGCVFQFRKEAGDNMINRGGGAGEAGNLWLRLVRAGKTVTAYVATDAEGKQWRRVAGEALETRDPVLVGMCVCSHANGMWSTAGFRDVTLASEEGGPSQPTDNKPSYPGLGAAG